MPSRNIVKSYIAGGFYHVYNRGVEKRLIFLDDQDYRVFLSYLKLYLTPIDKKASSESEKPHTDISGEVDLLAYCLMPNHIHLFVRQNTKDGMAKLMKYVTTRYVMYFNQRYKRVGGLFQGVYKAASVDKDDYYMHLSRYIHLNPKGIRRKYQTYPFSSYKYFISKPPKWLKPEYVLDLFANNQEYAKFVDDFSINSKEELGTIAID